MANLAPLILSVIGGGSVTSAVAAARWLSDERSQRRTEKRAAARAPLAQKSYELRIAKQADEILQETIDTLRENYTELKGQFAQHREEAAAQRSRDLQEHERQRRLDHEELDRARAEIEELTQKISDQNATIAALKFQLQGPGP